LFEILLPPWEKTHKIMRNASGGFQGRSSESCVRVWFSHFKKGDLSFEDEPHSGRPSNSQNDENIAKIREKLNEDCRYTIDELLEVTRVSWSSVQHILTQDLGMKRVAAKFVPRLLTEDQRKSRLTVCQDLKTELENDPNFLPHLPYSPDGPHQLFFVSPNEKGLERAPI
jgi:histone-lysine N-methyltransferase SETMAR